MGPKEHGRVEVSLNTDVRTKAPPSLVHGHGPVHADDIRPGRGHSFKEGPALFDVDDHGHLRVLRLDLRDYLRCATRRGGAGP